MRWSNLALGAALLALASCGGLPRPFEGAPGSVAAQLLAPPPARLAIPPAHNGGLAVDLTKGLRGMEVPAFATVARPGDWSVEMTGAEAGGMVTPAFTVHDPAGAARGSVTGPQLPAADWAQMAPATSARIAAAVVPQLGTLLTKIEAERRQNDPTSLVNRPARIYVADMVGAPGDGNASLARQMRRELPLQGFTVQDKPDHPDFSVVGTVKITPLPGNQESVEITWIIKDDAGAEAGKIAQLNQIPRGTLAGLWVDVAVIVAQEAAGGVHDVIANRIGTRKKP